MSSVARSLRGLGAVTLAILVAMSLIAGSFVLGIRAQALDIPTLIIVAICGDEIVTHPEVCDDGSANNSGQYASSTSERICEPGCMTFGPYCGDAILQVRFGEECDDGNNISGDLCSAHCIEEVPVPPRTQGAPPVGSVPPLPAVPGKIPSETLTKVVLRGKAYPGSTVNILLDGKKFGSVQADTNADFLFTTTNVTPGTATFGFNALDARGNSSITANAIFEIVQSAVTTVANIFLPPTISVVPDRVPPGSPVLISGQSVPLAHITAQIQAAASTSMSAITDQAGNWALQLDTTDLEKGEHAAKASFQLTDTIKSGWGKSVTFFVGVGAAPGKKSPDLNHDGKVNLVDFSIFLLSWQTDDYDPDFNDDQTVNLADFSIMLFAWTG